MCAMDWSEKRSGEGAGEQEKGTCSRIRFVLLRVWVCASCYHRDCDSKSSEITSKSAYSIIASFMTDSSADVLLIEALWQDSSSY